MKNTTVKATIYLSIISLILSFVMLPATAFADVKLSTAEYAQEITLGKKSQTKCYYSGEEYSVFLKYTPKSSGAYALTFYGDIAHRPLVYCCDNLDATKYSPTEYGNFSEYYDEDPFYKELSSKRSSHGITYAYSLKEKTTYYFNIISSDEVTLYYDFTKHTHTFETYFSPARYTGQTYSDSTVNACKGFNGKKCYYCDYFVGKEIPAITSINLSNTSYTYDAKVKRPTVTIKDCNGKTISNNNYSVYYCGGRKNVGKYTVIIELKNDYDATVKKTITIKPKSTSISSITPDKKKFAVKWKKQSTQTTGYQIQYSTDKNFKKNNKTVTVSKNSTTSKSISNLNANKKYYVRVRTFKTVSINSKDTNIYSSWSKAQSVKTK